MDIEGEPRQCYICLDVADEQVVVNEWVSPCRCSGSVGWVHQTCILRWVHEQEANVPGTRVTCAQCLTPIRITPSRGPIVTWIQYFVETIYFNCKVCLGFIFGMVALETTIVMIGIAALTTAFNVEEAQTLLTQMQAVEAMTGLYALTITLMIVSYVSWEEYALRLLRTGSRLPLLGNVLPSEAPAFHSNPQPRKSFRRTVVSAFLLPIFSRCVGELFFGYVNPPWKRCLCGAALFLVVKTATSMYLSQKLMLHRRELTVLPYEETIVHPVVRESRPISMDKINNMRVGTSGEVDDILEEDFYLAEENPLND